MLGKVGDVQIGFCQLHPRQGVEICLARLHPDVQVFGFYYRRAARADHPGAHLAPQEFAVDRYVNVRVGFDQTGRIGPVVVVVDTVAHRKQLIVGPRAQQHRVAPL